MTDILADKGTFVPDTWLKFPLDYLSRLEERTTSDPRIRRLWGWRWGHYRSRFCVRCAMAFNLEGGQFGQFLAHSAKTKNRGAGIGKPGQPLGLLTKTWQPIWPIYKVFERLFIYVVLRIPQFFPPNLLIVLISLKWIVVWESKYTK